MIKTYDYIKTVKFNQDDVGIVIDNRVNGEIKRELERNPDSVVKEIKFIDRGKNSFFIIYFHGTTRTY